MPTADEDLAQAVAALRAKLTPPDPRDGISAIDLPRPPQCVGIWPLRRDADAALRDLRTRGLNVDKGIRIQRARQEGRRPYVVTRVGDFGETLLMADDGSWVPGLLYPQRAEDAGALWLPYDGAGRIPPTFTHVTTTVLAAGRPERYRTKSNGSCGRWVTGDDSVARCTCGWKAYRDTRAEAQAAARVHRATPAGGPR